MADTRLGILIEALFRSQGFTQASKSLRDLEQSSKGTANAGQQIEDTWKRVAKAGATLAAGVYTAKKAFDFAQEGAQIRRIEDTFTKFAENAGENADSLRLRLRQATGGMVADTELLASTNRFLAMGLATTGSEASKLSEIAVTLGSAMGKEATPAMEEFALLLANQSIPRLDTFGISAGKVRTRIKELQAANAGMTRETAFMQAVMEEAQKSMVTLGDSVPTDEFTQFEAQLANMKDTAAKAASEGLGPLVKIAGDYLDFLFRGAEAHEALNRLVKDGTITQQQYRHWLVQVRLGAVELESVLLKLTIAKKAEKQATEELTRETIILRDEMDKYNLAARTAIDRAIGAGGEFRNLVGDAGSLNSALLRLRLEGFDPLRLAVQGAKSDTEDLGATWDSFIAGPANKQKRQLDDVAQAAHEAAFRLAGIPSQVHTDVSIAVEGLSDLERAFFLYGQLSTGKIDVGGGGGNDRGAESRNENLLDNTGSGIAP